MTARSLWNGKSEGAVLRPRAGRRGLEAGAEPLALRLAVQGCPVGQSPVSADQFLYDGAFSVGADLCDEKYLFRPLRRQRRKQGALPAGDGKRIVSPMRGKLPL